MLDPMRLHGIIPPLVTPFDGEGAFDAASYRRLVEFQITAGVHGIFCLGSSGEHPMVTEADRPRVVETAVAAAAGRVPVLIGVMDTSTTRTIQQARTAERAGADAVVLPPSFYFGSTQTELLAFYRAVRAAIGVPVVAYDIPSTVKTKLEAKTVLTLAREGTIVGIKDSSGNWDSFREVIEGTRDLPAFRIFTGSELMVDVAIFLGAHGAVPGIGNVLPAEFVALYEAARRGDWSEAKSLQTRLIPIFWKLIGQGRSDGSFTASAIGGFKSALKVRGIIATSSTGAPMVQFTAAEEEKVAAILRDTGLMPGV